MTFNTTQTTASRGISNDPPTYSNFTFNVDPLHEAVPELTPFSLLITLANSLVFLLFAKKPSLRTASNYLLISLAACDFFTGIVNIPITLIAFTRSIPQPKLSDLFFFVAVLHNFTAVSTGYHILAITLDKYMSFKRETTRITSKTTIFRVLCLVWTGSIAVAIVPFFWKNENTQSTRGRRLQMGHAIFCLTAVFVIPYTLMIYAYYVMYQVIKKAREQRQLEQNCREQHRKNEQRCVVIFVIMALLYLVCWLPWFSLALVYTVYPSEVTRGPQLDTVSHVFALVRYSTSVLNPILYTFFKRDFFTAFKEVILRKRYGEERFSSVLETARQSSCEAYL
ncbi:5-hydroxytryptamine receptor 2A-like [Acropora muricata]|uniref:5-hydroxytryptamine receptor 2A-like n=1 Tax=Acropora muricata TaxID=159855 RepID=UPI0034E4C537